MAANMQELSSDDLAQILRELFTVQSKWYNIGLSLGLNPATLDNINNTTNDACLRDMLNQRINQGGLTWEKIAKALEEVIVGRKGVARQIRARHLPPVATQAVLTTGNPMATRPLSSTNPVNPTAGPSNPSGSYPHNSAISFVIPIPVVPPPKTKPGPGKRPLDAPKPGPGKRPLVLDRQKPGPGKRPLDRPIAGPSKRPKKTKTEYYNEDMFVNPNTLQRYRCTHCKKVPKQFYQCQSIADNMNPKNTYSGLSCSDCRHLKCPVCKKKDQYERDTATDNRLRGLTVSCVKKCGATLLLRALDQHLSQECPKRRRPCRYSWVRCTFVGDRDTEELKQHEEDINVHFAPAMNTIHSMFYELRQRIDTVETWGTKQPQIDLSD